MPDHEIVLPIGDAEMEDRPVPRELDGLLDHAHGIVQVAHRWRVAEPDGLPVRVQPVHLRDVTGGERSQAQTRGLQRGQTVRKGVDLLARAAECLSCYPVHWVIFSPDGLDPKEVH